MIAYDYEVRCLQCGTREPADSLADAEAVMVLHHAVAHPGEALKLIRPRNAERRLAIERAER